MSIWKKKAQYQCAECRDITNEGEWDQIDDPALESNFWHICRVCRSADKFERICSYIGCKQQSGCGTSTPTGYRWTCGNHMPEKVE